MVLAPNPSIVGSGKKGWVYSIPNVFGWSVGVLVKYTSVV